MVEELKKEILEIKSMTEKTSRKSGESFCVVETDNGEYTCFEPAVIKELEKNVRKCVNVLTAESGKYKNIRQFNGVAEKQDINPKKVGESVANERLASVLASYAKDLTIAEMQTHPEFYQGEDEDMKKAMIEMADAVVSAYREISKKV